MNNPRFISNILNFIEERELDLISWGFYDTGLKPYEIENLLNTEASYDLSENWQIYKDEGGTIDELLSDMHFENLLYKLPNKNDTYRSRFSEGVRLIANLKQRFKYDDWSNARGLVSDIKIDLKNRKYPFWRIDTLLSNYKEINLEIINDGGWHFTNVKTPEELFVKLRNFGHHNEFELSNNSIID